jgi:hypothetical protein
VQQTHHPRRAGRIAGPQDRCDEVLPRLVAKGQAPAERQVAPVIAEAIEERQLLGAVGLVLGHIEIDSDQAHAAPPATMPRNDRVGQRFVHREQHPRRGRVLEARDRRLRRQASAVDRIAPEQQLVEGIVGEAVGGIAIGMATGDRVDALGEQIAHPVRDARRDARIGHRRRQGGQQVEPAVGRREQDRAAIRTGVRLIKGGEDRPIGRVRKKNRLC